MNQHTDLCLKFLDGDLTESEEAKLARLIVESPEVAGELARHLIDEHYFSQMQAQPIGESERLVCSDGSAVRHALQHLPDDQDANEVLKLLLQIEQRAQADIVSVDDEAAEESHDHGGEPLSTREVFAVLSDRETLKAFAASIVRSKPLQWIAAAAVLLLGLTLLIVFAGPNSTTPAPEFAQAPAPFAETKPVVATLTAERNAQWQDASGTALPIPGDPLRAGQRLVLTEGHIELTTNRGAIAAIQAPCTFELLDDDNALILHSGKLVGICQAPRSKGFVVKTHYGDIKDIGTEFGVHAQHGKVTATVFNGEIEVTADGGKTQSITTNQTARLDIDIDAQVFAVEDQLEASFEPLYTRPTLPNLSRWQRHLARLDEAHGLIGQLSFDANGPVATPGKGIRKFNAQIVGGTIRPGDEQRGTAASLLIDDENQGINLSFDPKAEHKQITLVTWMRVNRAQDQNIATFMYPAEKREDAISLAWHMGHSSPSLMALPPWQFDENESKKLYRAPLDEEVQGRWHCFALTVNTETQQSDYYVDGRHIGTAQWLFPGGISLGKMRIGDVDKTHSTAENSRYINGDCGLFLALGSLLSQEQIDSLYQSSKDQFIHKP